MIEHQSISIDSATMPEVAESTKVVLSFEVDISETSSMFCCMICQELIQSANDHRQCASQPGGDGCGGTICVPCISNLNKHHCPTCGNKYPGVFVACPLIKKMIYPRISTKCPLGCGLSFLTPDSHISKCERRIVSCPVCANEIRVDDVLTHLNTSCKLPWMTRNVDHASEWSDIMILICANPFDPERPKDMMSRVRLNPKSEFPTSENERMIYVWREDDLIKLFCIQLSAAAGETQPIGLINNSECVTCPINSYALFPGAISIQASKFLDYDISLGFGPWNLIIGAYYKVATGDDNDPMLPDVIARNFHSIGTFHGQLLEVLWGPPRGVFVNQSGQTYMANLDAQTMTGIKLVNSVKNVQPVRYSRFMAPMANQNNAIPALFSIICNSIARLPRNVMANQMPEMKSESKIEENGEDLSDDEGGGSDSDIPDLEPNSESKNNLSAGEISVDVITRMTSGDPITGRELRQMPFPARPEELVHRTLMGEHAMMELDNDLMTIAIAASLEDHS